MLSFNFSPFPELTTTRLLLRELSLNDAAGVHELRSDKDVMRYINRPLTETVEDAAKWVAVNQDLLQKNEAITWCICLKEQPEKHIGSIGFWRIQKENYRAEIGYMLHPSFHRQGILSEAMQVVLPYAFNEMKLHSIEAHVEPLNIASSNLLLKAGFVREAYFRENFFFNGKFGDTAVYSLLAPSD